ncbi:DUF6124 family protein [Pseudomonas fluorescens]|uniref:DUF3077 domain-containing protein n=1 Tax=Pseudomonas fluorescens TaxID=294 RepID=A0A944DYL1_PSEFL|nr:DUF6124 family protein [Pseudomonas fluorescens]MBT2294966.1 hypothetical protein [Pseudomonas fluorescens]MBT2309194.1 hypothetical protein [Pseudomonas fluorescens]MBT2313662.1 hypothetical protein [Pseudomonas fluorescens]MBT2318378.1 hypothetical protein [Pseudomonas fluorescens]MBT2329301.1 hypothetical protein [Pseudomonas fluorescens]
MFKIKPNPAEADPNSSYLDGLNAKKIDEASKRALDYYLAPKPAKPTETIQPGQLFTVVKDIDNESLLANLSESLASADAMISNLAFDLEGPRRHIALGIQQLIELSSLLASRVLDNVDPR